MKTGAELKARRLELKITQQDLADKIGVSRTQLSRMENGKIEISSDIYMKIEAVLTSNEEYKEPELTINDIQAGDELECIDPDSFMDDARKTARYGLCNDHIVASRGFIVKNTNYDCVYIQHISELYIQKEYLKYFRKRTSLQFSDLEVGDYVYVRDDLEHKNTYGAESFFSDVMIKGCLASIERISNGKEFFIKGYFYTPEMIDLSRSMKKEDYLKMGEKEIASFEELQYVANKALDESIIEKYEVSIGSYGNKNMIIHFDGKFTEYSDNSTNSGIEFIQSLYTEEFVINEYEDLKKINLKSSKVNFLNGFETEIIGVDWQQDGGNISLYDGEFYIDFNILKGSTVKQSKGDK